MYSCLILFKFVGISHGCFPVSFCLCSCKKSKKGSGEPFVMRFCSSQAKYQLVLLIRAPPPLITRKQERKQQKHLFILSSLVICTLNKRKILLQAQSTKSKCTSPRRHKPQNIQFIFESSRFFCQTCELIITVLNLNQLLLQLFTVDPVVILSCLQPKRQMCTIAQAYTNTMRLLQHI